jgi:hypothetical protein
VDEGTQAASEAPPPAQSRDKTAATSSKASAEKSSDASAATKGSDRLAADKPSGSKTARGDEKPAAKDAATTDSGKSEQMPNSDKSDDDAKSLATGGEKPGIDGKVLDVQQPLATAAMSAPTGAAPAGPVTTRANNALAVATGTTSAAVNLAARPADHTAKATEEAAVQQLAP